ncbi:MAG: urea carboxylase-associated family protein, partial [Thermoleophilia bacterium]|nr:urea carboxylase-associated family protein [Thermoleophilia bacterium]
GQAIQIVNTHGHQVVDTWAFSAEDMGEFLSMEHLRPTIGTILPTKGHALVTNRRRPILLWEEDTSPGIHDTIIAACDDYRYGLLGCTGYHDNCTDNLHAALRAIGLKAPETPSPLNLWMNIPVGPGGAIQWGEPRSKPGDHVILRAVMDCVVVMSACPQDILPINGLNPVEAHYRVLG